MIREDGIRATAGASIVEHGMFAMCQNTGSKVIRLANIVAGGEIVDESKEVLLSNN
jgi:hypothetical protein